MVCDDNWEFWWAEREEELTLSSWCVCLRDESSLFGFSYSNSHSRFHFLHSHCFHSSANRLHLLFGSEHTVKKRMASRRFALRVERFKGWDVRIFAIFVSELWQLTRNCWWWWSGALISSHFPFSLFHSLYGPLGHRWPGNVWQTVCKLTEAHSHSFSFSADHTVTLCRVCFESPLSAAEPLLMVINYNGTTLALPNAQALIHTDTSFSSFSSFHFAHTLQSSDWRDTAAAAAAAGDY